MIDLSTLPDITQADRDAAADFLTVRKGSGPFTDAMRNGKLDKHALVQAFAQHRITALNALEAENLLMRDERDAAMALLEPSYERNRALLAENRAMREALDEIEGHETPVPCSTVAEANAQTLIEISALARAALATKGADSND